MRLPTLLLVLFALGARAATIVDKKEVDFEKKLEDTVKEILKEEIPAENVSSEQELLDQANVIKDVDNNNLRKNIPVVVVVEDVKSSLKKEQIIPNEVAPANDDNIKRAETYIDLANPGEPQHQEHDVQNPTHYDEKPQTISAIIKQNIEQTQNVFNNNLQQLQQTVQNWWNSNQNNQIQQQIQQLQQNFQSQIEKLNQTAHKYWSNVDTPAPLSTGIQNLENEVNAGVKSIAQSVEAVINGKAENSSTSTPSFPFFQGGNPIQVLQQHINQGFQNFQAYFNNSQSASQNSNGTNNIFQNWGQGVQNIFNPGNNNASTQSDEGSAPQRPTIWQGITNFFNPLNPGNQGQQPPAGQQADTPVKPPTPNRPIVQAIQNNPLYQQVASVFQPNKPVANNSPTSETKPDPEKPSEGSNVVPKPGDDKQKVKPETYAQSGPIKQILVEKNPLVQGIAGAMQRIQQSITSAEKPRDVVENGEKIVEKGGFGGYYGGGHRPTGAATEHNNDSNGLKVKSDSVEDNKEVIPLENPVDQSDGKPSEAKKPVVEEKTE